MSAYIVEDETISRIVNYLRSQAEHPPILCLDLSPLATAGHNLRAATDQPAGTMHETCERLGMAMHLLNVGAVRSRYEDADDGGMIGPAYRYESRCPGPAMKAYKSLRCWLYQCCEGTADKSPLHVAMARLSDDLAHGIIQESAQYGEIEWA